jgi:hypothetical protein
VRLEYAFELLNCSKLSNYREYILGEMYALNPLNYPLYLRKDLPLIVTMPEQLNLVDWMMIYR